MTNVSNAYAKAINDIKGKLEGDYQHEGVKWMLGNELGEPDTKGGILADDMGLGKTMQSIALMRGNPTATLIVTMVSLVGQWKDALITFGGYCPIIVNPSFMGILPDMDDNELVVLTSYSSFQKSRGHTPHCLNDTQWGRIILDEGHTIRNHKTKLFTEVQKLKAKHRWILSGTPLQNSEKDLWNLLQWIGVQHSNNIHDMCQKYLLRRVQSETKNLVLPRLTTHVKYLEFKHEKEKELYEDIERYYEEKMANSNNCQNTAMEGIIRCRQVCTHPTIYFEGCDRSKDKKRKVSVTTQQFDTSTKFEYLCDDIQELPKGTKCLVFCSWTMEMKLIQHALKERKISSLTFDGSLSRDAKDSVIYNFKHSKISVLVLQINCGANGLNLQCASRVYMMSPHWNPCVELQAIGRAYRKGQAQEVICIRFIMKGTVEERCLEIQQHKASMIIETMLDESIQAKLGSLSQDELKNMFIKTTISEVQPEQEDIMAVEDLLLPFPSIDDQELDRFLTSFLNTMDTEFI